MANKSRPKQLSFRVSEEEYQQLQEKISKSGKNQQEYILSCVLEKPFLKSSYSCFCVVLLTDFAKVA